MELTIQNITAIIVLLGTTLIIIVLALALPFIINDIERGVRRKKFITAINKASEAQFPTWNQLQIIAKRYHLDKGQMKLAFERMLHDYLVDREQNSIEMVALIEEAILEIEKNEPFEGIPDRVVLQLEHLKDKASEDISFDLLPLANELRSLRVKEKKEKRNRNIVAITSLFVGIIGTGFGVVSYFNVNKDISMVGESEPQNNKPIKSIQPTTERGG